MAVIIKVNTSGSTLVNPIEGNWNNVPSAGITTPATLLVPGLLDDFDVSTGFTLSTVDGFSVGSQERLGNADGPYWGWEQEVWQTLWSSKVDAQTQLRVGGLPVGTAFSMYISGEGFGATRDTNFSVTGGDNSPQLYDNTGSTGSPTEPVTLTGIVDGTGNIDISMAIVDTTVNINAFVLTLAIPTITTHEGNIQLEPGVTSDQGIVP